MEQKPAAVPPQKAAALLEWVRHYRQQAVAPFSILTFLTGIVIALTLLTPVPFAILFDAAFSNVAAPGFLNQYSRTPQLLYWLAGIVVVLFFVQRLFTLALTYTENLYRFQLKSQVERDFYLHMMRLPQNVKKLQSDEAYITQLTTSAGAVAERYITTYLQIVQSALMIGAIVIVLARTSLPTAMLSLIIVSPLYLSVHYFSRKRKSLPEARADTKRKITQFLQESIAGSNVVQAFNRETTQQDHFFDMQAYEYGLTTKKIFIKNAQESIERGLLHISVVAIIIVGGGAVYNGFITAGQLLLFGFYLTLLRKPLVKIQHNVAQYKEQTKAIATTFDFIYDLPEQKNSVATPLPIARANGQLVYQNIVVTKNGTPVLNGINLTIEPGQKVGIIGPSGSGKSALLSLPPRLNSWSAGAVYLDGNDVRSYDLYALRQQFSYVEQHPTVFSDTIFGNVAFGRTEGEVNIAEVTAALGAAGAYDFVKALPRGLDTTIGIAGEVKLSHAQEQQIAIARAFMHNAPVLLLDEPFSLVEGDQSEVLRSVTELMKGRTVLIATHQLELLEKVDVIYVVENGVLRDVNEYGGIAAYHDVIQALSPETTKPTPAQEQ